MKCSKHSAWYTGCQDEWTKSLSPESSQVSREDTQGEGITSFLNLGKGNWGKLSKGIILKSYIISKETGSSAKCLSPGRVIGIK